jgi:hypothetical protein
VPNHKGATLAYRTTPEEVKQVIEAINRRRSIEQIQTLFPSPTAFQSAMQAAIVLGFVDADTNSLRPSGRDYLLQADKRTEIMLNAMCHYEPYGLLLEAIFVRDTPAETPTEWIIDWWSANEYGASPNNREEAATTFGKLIEAVGLGTFMLGRRGKSTRIQWTTGAAKRIKEILDGVADDHTGLDASEVDANPSLPTPDIQPATRGEPIQSSMSSAGTKATTASHEYASMSIPLSGNRIAEVRLPARLSLKDKTRLIQIVELLIEVDDEQGSIVTEE